jgi:hypothetical protein
MPSSHARILVGLMFATHSIVALAEGPATSRLGIANPDRLRQAVREAVPRTDLVIEHVEWSARAASSRTRGENPETVVIESAQLRVIVRNAGTARWASEGRLAARVLPGRPQDLDAAERRPRGSAGADRTIMDREAALTRLGRAPLGPFRGEVPLSGSLAPGERREVSIPITYLALGRRIDHTLLFAFDKYYTARVDLDVRGDDEPTNNGADLVFRVDRRGHALEPLLQARRTHPEERGTVEIAAPKH